jgi:poly-gamma-glutamate synthase PgsB/CapB
VGKTTGTAARIIDEHGVDRMIERKEVNISEQRRELERFAKEDYSAAVFECMAVNPDYVAFLEHKVMHSTIAVLTNIRHDHMDVLGSTLPEIAESMSKFVPFNGKLVTAERNEEVLEVFRKVCRQRNTELIVADNDWVTDDEIESFGYFEFKDNVAIGLAIAKELGIERSVAMKGMLEAAPDPGAFEIVEREVKNKKVTWVNLFAANDSDSFTQILGLLKNHRLVKNRRQAVVLNNRKDRPDRVHLFADLVKGHKDIDYVFTFGDYENDVEKVIADSKRLLKLGNGSADSSLSGEGLLSKMSDFVNEERYVLIGAVNIHSPQAVALRGELN